MPLEVTPALLGLAVTACTILVGSAVQVVLAARDARDAASEVKSHAETLIAIRVAQGRHEERLDAHEDEIGRVRSGVAENATAIARIVGGKK